MLQSRPCWQAIATDRALSRTDGYFPMLCRLLASTTNHGGSRFLRDGIARENPRRIEGALSGWVLSVYRPAGLFETETHEPKMRNETIHRCPKCGIAPVYQTARITEPLDDVPSILFRLQCPNCGRYGAYCTTKQAAVGYWNREPFIPPRGRKK